MTDAKIWRVQRAVSDALEDLESHFIPDAQLSFVMRVPGRPDTYMIVSNDALGEVVATIRRDIRKRSGRSRSSEGSESAAALAAFMQFKADQPRGDEPAPNLERNGARFVSRAVQADWNLWRRSWLASAVSVR